MSAGTAGARPYQIEIKKPSDIERLGGVLKALGANDGDAMRYRAMTVPQQLRELLARKGVDEASITEITQTAETQLREAAAILDSLIPVGESVERIYETVVYLLRARQSKPVEVGGYTISGVSHIAM